MLGSHGVRRLVVAGATTVLVAAAAIGVVAASPPRPHTPQVLLVGTFHGVKGQYSTIQAAVNAAKPGDWVLVAPSDYHESDDLTTTPSQLQYQEGGFGGVVITTNDLHLRGMQRATTVIDGTRPGAPQCSSAPADQEFGALVGGNPAGRNGIVVWQANGVTIDNLTACNWLSGSQNAGNGIWWDGGDGSGMIGLTGYEGSYLTATSTYFGTESAAATYGIFSSNAQGPGVWSQLYANNQNDSGIYVGGCRQVCGITISRAWMEYNALGYSGTNSGGAIVITNSRFDHNQDGFDTNTQVAGDAPAPQNGACPGNGISKITHTHSCWVLMNSVFADNNNSNAPAAGGAAQGPTGTGMTLSGGKNDTVLHDTFIGNNAWGILFVPYPDKNPPSNGQTCAGAGGHQYSGLGCVIDPQGNALIGNTFKSDGGFKNPTNSDFGELTLSSHVVNCFSKNVEPQGSYPKNLEKVEAKCTGATAAGNAFGPGLNLYNQVVCDTGLGTCPAGSHYPAHGTVELHAVPKLPTMPNPCAGVPSNPWCKGGKPI